MFVRVSQVNYTSLLIDDANCRMLNSEPRPCKVVIHNWRI